MKPRLRSVFTALLLLTTAPFPALAQEDNTPPVGRLPQSVVPKHYSIELTIDPAAATFTGKVAIDVHFRSPQNAFWVHGRNLQVTEVFLTDAPSNRIDAKYEERHDSGVALISLAREAAAGPAQLHFAYSAPFNDAGNALYRTNRRDQWYAATQFEPIGARQVFPGFDEPAFKVPFDLAVVARKGHVAVTTTPEVAAEDLPDGMVRHVFARTRPLPTYLLAFAVGPYDVVEGNLPGNNIRDREVPLRGIAAQGQGAKMQYALRHTPGILGTLEQYFGTGYPYEKLDLIAVPLSFGGAMENVGAITYDEYLMLMDEKSPLDQRRSYTDVHAHELAHMWFGNLVTPAWWDDIWLNESFASWMSAKAAEAYWPEGEFSRSTLQGALGAMSNDSLASARRIHEPVTDSSSIGSAFDGITYEKGAGVLAMLERFIGTERFRAGVRLHMARHKDGTATSDDFMASLARAAGMPAIQAAFRSFIDQAGVPQLEVAVECGGKGGPQLKVRQSRYAPLGSTIDPNVKWTIPFCTAFESDGIRKDFCTLIEEPEETVPLGKGACPDWLHPNADGAGYYRFALDEGSWRNLIANTGNLGTAEALTLADSLDAAFRANRVPADLYVSGMASLAGHEAWEVVSAATGYLEGMIDLFDKARLPAVEKALRAIVGPRLARLAGAEDAASVLLRQDLQRFLAVIARDPELRRTFAGQAAAIIGLNGKANPDAAPVTEYETVLTAGVQDIGEPFFDLLLEKALASDDPAFRDAALGALARTEEPALARKLQDAVLTRKVEGPEAVSVIFRQMIRPATTDLTYAWIRANAPTVIDLIPETFRSNTVPAFGNAFCSPEKAAEWQQFIAAHAGKLPGHERSLAQTMEGIHLCAALKSRAAELLTAFQAYAR